MTNSRLELGKRIRQLRTDKNLTAKVLAKEAGISASYLSEVEQGVSAISSEKLLGIAQQLGVSVNYLLEGDLHSQSRNLATAAAVQIPASLSQAAKELNLSFSETERILVARQNLAPVAARSARMQQEMTAEEWKGFYKKVKQFMEE